MHTHTEKMRIKLKEIWQQCQKLFVQFYSQLFLSTSVSISLCQVLLLCGSAKPSCFSFLPQPEVCGDHQPPYAIVTTVYSKAFLSTSLLLFLCICTEPQLSLPDKNKNKNKSVSSFGGPLQLIVLPLVNSNDLNSISRIGKTKAWHKYRQALKFFLFCQS